MVISRKWCHSETCYYRLLKGSNMHVLSDDVERLSRSFTYCKPIASATFRTVLQHLTRFQPNRASRCVSAVAGPSTVAVLCVVSINCALSVLSRILIRNTTWDNNIPQADQDYSATKLADLFTEQRNSVRRRWQFCVDNHLIDTQSQQ